MTGRDRVGCLECPLASWPGFKDLPAAERRRLEESRVANRHRRGDTLFYEGNPAAGLYFLCRGRVKIVKSDGGGRQQIARVVEGPDLLGDRALVAGEPYAGTAVVMDEARVCLLPGLEFGRLCASYPALAWGLARRFARQLGRAEESALDLVALTIRERLARFLLRERPAQGRPGAAREVLIAESRHEIADILGTSPEAVSRGLAELRAKGLISLSGRRLRILDEAALHQVARLARPARAACPRPGPCGSSLPARGHSC